MGNFGLRDTVATEERSREFWRGVLLAGGTTTFPRWTRTPTTGVGEHATKIPRKLVAALCQLADELAMPLSSVLLTAHAKVLAALTSQREVWTGYSTLEDRPPFPLRIM